MTSLLDLPQAASSTRSMALEMLNIRHAYDAHVALKDVSLDVAPGEVVCLLGPSGCGKTTLLRIAAGLEVLQQGRVCLNGREIGAPGARHVPPEKRNVGLAFQDFALFPHLTVLENVTFGLKAQPMAQRRERAYALLEQLGMARCAKSYPHMLSGGQQQRVALARALAPAPQLMLLDEPFSGLDARLRERTRDDTLHVLKNAGAGTLLVTHDPEEAMFMADRIALMNAGRIVQMGTPQELYCMPSHPFVVTFFGSANELFGEVRNGMVQTPVGPVAAHGLADGVRAQVLIRPEALQVSELDTPPEAQGHSHVVMAKLLGRSSLLRLCAYGLDGQEVYLHASMPGVFLPAPGQPVRIQLDPSQVFVFPAEPDTTGA